MRSTVVRAKDVEVRQTDWGSMQWLVPGPQAASENMTLGRVSFKPGEANPVHRHPNCEEVLYVVAGEIEHTLPEGGTARLGPGDCIVLPPGRGHQARNVGPTQAEAIVAFNTPDRQTVGE